MSQSSFESTELPHLTPRTQCVLIARDPNYIYAYWNYTQEDLDRLCQKLGSSQLVLRVYDTVGGHTWDMDVGFSTKNSYINVWQDNVDYCVELGVRSADNDFKALAMSNSVRTPAKTASRRDDLIWQDIKFQRESQPYVKEVGKKKLPHGKKLSKARVYQLTVEDIRRYYMDLFAKVSPRSRRKKQLPMLENILKGRLRGVSLQKSNPFIKRPDLIQKLHPGASEGQLSKGGSSEGNLQSQSGASEERLNQRKFFFEIWTELLVYGRTEPDAALWLNDKGIKLNPDGTFSLRYALPDGVIPFKFIAQSSDGVEERHITTRVEREKTTGFPKMLKDFHA